MLFKILLLSYVCTIIYSYAGAGEGVRGQSPAASFISDYSDPPQIQPNVRQYSRCQVQKISTQVIDRWMGGGGLLIICTILTGVFCASVVVSNRLDDTGEKCR